MTRYLFDYPAYNTCDDDLFEPFGITLDCSLCKAGWPMGSGWMGISFYGPKPTPESDPAPSCYWPIDMNMVFGCVKTKTGVPPPANIWVTSGTGQTADGKQIKLEVRLIQTGNHTINLYIRCYIITDDKKGWSECFTINQNMHDIQGDCIYCIRGYESGFVPVDISCCGGDLAYVKFHVGTFPWAEGCGPRVEDGGDDEVPYCGLFDGEHTHSCFRAWVKSKTTPPAFNPKFYQLGYRHPAWPGGKCSDRKLDNANSYPCQCIRTRRSDNNGDRTLRYLNIGCPSGEGLNDVQFIQVLGTDGPPDFDIVIKNTFGNPLCIAIREENAANFTVVSNPVVMRNDHLLIIKAETTNVIVYLYAMNFPTEEILPAECTTTQPPETTTTTLPPILSWFCTEAVIGGMEECPNKSGHVYCVQWPAGTPIGTYRYRDCMGELIYERTVSTGYVSYAVCASSGCQPITTTTTTTTLPPTTTTTTTTTTLPPEYWWCTRVLSNTGGPTCRAVDSFYCTDDWNPGTSSGDFRYINCPGSTTEYEYQEAFSGSYPSETYCNNLGCYPLTTTTTTTTTTLPPNERRWFCLTVNETNNWYICPTPGSKICVQEPYYGSWNVGDAINNIPCGGGFYYSGTLTGGPYTSYPLCTASGCDTIGTTTTTTTTTVSPTTYYCGYNVFVDPIFYFCATQPVPYGFVITSVGYSSLVNCQANCGETTTTTTTTLPPTTTTTTTTTTTLPPTTTTTTTLPPTLWYCWMGICQTGHVNGTGYTSEAACYADSAHNGCVPPDEI